MQKPVVTTGRKNASRYRLYAEDFAQRYGLEFHERKGSLVDTVSTQPAFLAGGGSLRLYAPGGTRPLSFHPSSAHLRVHDQLNGSVDPLIRLMPDINGARVLDCTFGMGSDSLLMAWNHAEVTALESSFPLYILMHESLRNADRLASPFNEAAKRIELLHINAEVFLASCKDNDFDYVYIDPMFHTPVLSSAAIDPLRTFADHAEPNDTFIAEAKRVAARKIILKDHFSSKRFDQFGFKHLHRKHASFHYGYIKCGEGQDA
ncbi:class I SAM-dependent methyltransferase [Alkalicoccus luteus]|uniref:Class I SAM-dependent methyltransferase n=1 Tax=Alkalicoccus luteus TaxID=1237094 RepID=A0A969TS74_9BACI|nr:class I SAM-dependent methyltransferase [Alkalicoccus luteus]NJP36278.1 class I SAM-dependent methyltransferase [Alkalicoccus luteus]